ncbi:MAG: GGDEF domain-containing protein [Actinobacteria bacterium]|nr:GGDEF domain-containing protein [Actinomycetota bacterium]
MSAQPANLPDAGVARSLADASEIADARERRHSRLLGRERTVTLLLGSAFVFTATACAALIPSSRPFSVTVAALLVVVYAVVSQVEFEIGPGSAVPTQLVLVPMLFVLPLGAVPLCVAGGLLLGGVFERLRARRHGERVAVLLCSSWHSVGPALVIGVLAPGAPRWEHVSVYVLAFVAQCGLDAGAVIVRHRLGREVPISRLAPALGWVALVDAALAPVAVLVALAVFDEPAAILCVLPLAGLLQNLGTQRRRRIDESVMLGQAVQDASRVARSDPLTGIGNRLAWQEAVERARRSHEEDGSPVSVLLVDLNRLKETNDTYGHDAGDRLIQALATALRAAAREGDELARIGGDEFAVLLIDADEHGHEEVAKRIRRQLAGLAAGEVTGSASLGAASCPPCRSLDEAFRLADERLYRAKLWARSTNP